MSNKRIAKLSIVLVFALFISVFPLVPTTAATNFPTGVEGRILTPDLSGDTSNWLEIARYEGYSLIVRTNSVLVSVHECCTSNVWSFTRFGETNRYSESRARDRVNMWFNIWAYQSNPNCTFCTSCKCDFASSNDALPLDARLRDFTMQSDVMSKIGTGRTLASLTNGFSIPSNSRSRNGTDVAFLLSFSEVANFVSERRSLIDAGGMQADSPPIAIANFSKMNMPPDLTPTILSTGMWLRSSGTTNQTASALSRGGTASQYSLDTFASRERGYIFPALWVDSSIFYTGPRTVTVTGLVWPMVASNMWGLGDNFMRMHDIVVELRPTFRTPAAPELSTTSVLVDSTGLGAFTIENVLAGDYVLHIKRPGYLARGMLVSITESSPDVVILTPPGTEENGVFRLWWGDCNDDGRIDNEDILMILELMDLSVNALHPLYNPHCDFNGDGLIDNDEILMVLEMWNRNLLQYPGAENINPFE
jgi:hypothetical protein